MTAGPDFYCRSARQAACTRADVLAGRVIRLSPALITIIDGRVESETPEALRREVLARVGELLAHRAVRSLHVDINYADYSGFGDQKPDFNEAVFTPDFVGELNAIARSYEGYVTLHLLTDDPERRLRAFAAIPLGAVCFQLDAVLKPDRLAALVEQISALGACASPVIETVGSDQRPPLSTVDARKRLEPLLHQIGMLTFQAAGTAARSNLPAGVFAREQVAAAVTALRPGFSGTIQVQGGIQIGTVGAAVGVGADFLVVGTQLFRNRDGLPPLQVVKALLAAAADGWGV